MVPFFKSKNLVVNPPPRLSGFKAWGTVLLSLFFISLSFNLIGLLSDHTTVWMHPEVAGVYLPETLATGADLNWNDVKKGLHPVTFEPVPRARALSNLALIINVKFRQWIWNLKTITPHPSFNLNWIAVLFLSPLFLYLFLKNLSKQDSVALTGILLYYGSIPALSDLAMFFHSAKPFATFFFFLCLWLAGLLNDAMETGRKDLTTKRWLYLLFAMGLGFFTDECFAFVYCLIPAAYPKIFADRQNRVKFLFPIVLFVVYLTMGMRLITDQRAFMDNVIAMRNIYGYHPSYYFVTLKNLILETLSPKGIGNWNILFSGLVGMGLIVAFMNSLSNYKACVLRFCVALAVFQILETIILARHLQYLTTGYCYGNYFMVFFVIVVSLALNLPQRLNPRHLLLGTLLLVSVYNFRVENIVWIDRHQKIFEKFKPKELQTLYQGNLELNAETTKKLVTSRRLKGEIPKQLRPSSMWLSTELGLRP